ncbi:MAG: OmpA family protein [bacterium]
MKKIIPVIITITVLFLPDWLSAQTEHQLRLNIAIGGSSGINEALQQSLNPMFGAGLTWENVVAEHFSFEANAAFGKLSSPKQGGYSEYSTTIIPIDARIKYAPLDGDLWQPYLYAGLGFVHYSINSASPNASSSASTSGFSPYFPVGIGMSHRISESIRVEFKAGENASFTDDLNPVRDGRNDAFWGFSIGISIKLNSANASHFSGSEFDLGERGSVRVLTHVVFDSLEATIKPISEFELNQILSALNNHDDIEVEFRDYLDDSGEFNESMTLTQQRAESLKVWFVSRGVPAGRISTQGYGPHNPLVPNNSPENMALNRRVEIVRMK